MTHTYLAVLSKSGCSAFAAVHTYFIHAYIECVYSGYIIQQSWLHQSY